MLGKLFKYDLKANARILLPLYGALLVVAVLLAAFFKGTSDLTVSADAWSINPTNVIGTIITILYIMLIFASILITVVIVLQNYYRNLLGDQGYLMFTLPVKIQTHVTEKSLCGGFWIFVSALVAGVSFCLIGMIGIGPKAAFEALHTAFTKLIEVMGVGVTASWGILILVLALVASLEFTMKVYAAISVGHLAKKHRGGISILAYIGFSVIESVIANIANMFKLDEVLNRLSLMQHGTIVMLVIIGVVLILTFIYWIISSQVLKRNLNLQ